MESKKCEKEEARPEAFSNLKLEVYPILKSLRIRSAPLVSGIVVNERKPIFLRPTPLESEMLIRFGAQESRPIKQSGGISEVSCPADRTYSSDSVEHDQHRESIPPQSTTDAETGRQFDKFQGQLILSSRGCPLGNAGCDRHGESFASKRNREILRKNLCAY